MTAYYNEIDPNAAEWLRQLIKMGQIAPGDVDERSIEDVTPDELRTYTQCHFFAGIGVWSYALRQAGWEDYRPVWTGSCPCQPFSAAGKGGGVDDERHLWPAMFWLIQQCRPETVFGEQVASKDGLGWWDIVSADLEGSGYACGANDLCAAGVGAPHIRQRLYWVANAMHPRRWVQQRSRESDSIRDDSRRKKAIVASDVIDGHHAGRHQASSGPGACSQDDGMADAKGAECQCAGGARAGRAGSTDGGFLVYPNNTGLQSDGCGVLRSQNGQAQGGFTERTSTANPWANPEWLYCRDGKARPTQPGIFPLVDGSTSRVGRSGDISIQESQSTAEGRVMRLKGYGNAIVGPLAAEFIGAVMEATP